MAGLAESTQSVPGLSRHFGMETVTRGAPHRGGALRRIRFERTLTGRGAGKAMMGEIVTPLPEIWGGLLSGQGKRWS